MKLKKIKDSKKLVQALILKVSQVNMRKGYGLKVCRGLLIE